MCRNTTGRWAWVNAGSSATIKNNGSPAMLVTDPNHPIFKGLPIDEDGLINVLDPNVGEGHTSFFDNTVTGGGNGQVLSTCLGTVAQSPWIIEWPAGVEFFTGLGQVTGDLRMLFSVGTQDKVVLSASPQGAFNLNSDGVQLLRNVMNYMMTPVPSAN
jgi:hypothetical protein